MAARKALSYAFDGERGVAANALCFSLITVSPFDRFVIKVDISVYRRQNPRLGPKTGTTIESSRKSSACSGTSATP